MSDVIGPNSYLPGQILSDGEGQFCDEHPDRLAAGRIISETDSFGSEIIHACQECLDQHRQAMETTRIERETTPTHCEIGNHMGLDVRPFRDPEEGSCGRLYDACKECRKRIMDYWNSDDY